MLSNNDVPTGVARIPLEAHLTSDWEGWSPSPSTPTEPHARLTAAAGSRRKCARSLPRQSTKAVRRNLADSPSSRSRASSASDSDGTAPQLLPPVAATATAAEPAAAAAAANISPFAAYAPAALERSPSVPRPESFDTPATGRVLVVSESAWQQAQLANAQRSQSLPVPPLSPWELQRRMAANTPAGAAAAAEQAGTALTRVWVQPAQPIGVARSASLPAMAITQLPAPPAGYRSVDLRPPAATVTAGCFAAANVSTAAGNGGSSGGSLACAVVPRPAPLTAANWSLQASPACTPRAGSSSDLGSSATQCSRLGGGGGGMQGMHGAATATTALDVHRHTLLLQVAEARLRATSMAAARNAALHSAAFHPLLAYQAQLAASVAASRQHYAAPLPASASLSPFAPVACGSPLAGTASLAPFVPAACQPCPPRQPPRQCLPSSGVGTVGYLIADFSGRTEELPDVPSAGDLECFQMAGMAGDG